MFNIIYLLLFHGILIWHASTFTSAVPNPESFGKSFSFSILLDIKQLDGDKVGKIPKCEENYAWDPNLKRCRTLKGVFPGYVAKDGKEMDFTNELEEINGTCYNEHKSCKENKDFQFESINMQRCICNRPCANLRACCFDSLYKNLPPTVQGPSCTKATGQASPIFMIEKCPDTEDLELKTKCEIGWNEDDEDYLLLLPVVSLVTNMTYKNYYCFSCNEDHDERLYWNMILSANIESDTVIKDTNIVPVYDHSEKSWMAPFGTGGELINISLKVVAPEAAFRLTKLCLRNVIADCAETWEDDECRYKCSNLPTLITSFKRDNFIYYKNPYCALCNFEDLNQKVCYIERGEYDEKFFSFSLLLDINRSDGDKVGKIQKCEENHVWDPHFKKCRALKCALSGYVVKDGKCTEEA